MTENAFDYSKSALSPTQQGRAEALKVSASVLSSTSGIFGMGTKPPTTITGVDDLLKVSDWVLDTPSLPNLSDGQWYSIDRGQLPGFLESLLDAKNPFDDTDEDEVPWEQHGSNPDREVDPRDLSGGEADVAGDDGTGPLVPEGASGHTPPKANPSLHGLGVVFVNDGMRWRVSEKSDGSKYWQVIGSDLADAAEDHPSFD